MDGFVLIEPLYAVKDIDLHCQTFLLEPRADDCKPNNTLFPHQINSTHLVKTVAIKTVDLSIACVSKTSLCETFIFLLSSPNFTTSKAQTIVEPTTCCIALIVFEVLVEALLMATG